MPRFQGSGDHGRGMGHGQGGGGQGQGMGRGMGHGQGQGRGHGMGRGNGMGGGHGMGGGRARAIARGLGPWLSGPAMPAPPEAQRLILGPASAPSTQPAARRLPAGDQVAKVDAERCMGCGICVDVCADGALSFAMGGGVQVDEATCTGCGACVETCPLEVIEMVAKQ